MSLTFQQATVANNIEWFNENDHYAETQSRLECYRHIKKIVERELRGEGDVLDVGNGGFFNYDTALARHVTAVDLFLEDGEGPTPNSTFRRGSLLDLPFVNESFDCILQQNVLHHVTGRTVVENRRNLNQCVREMFRCTRRGGKTVIIESTVGPLFYCFEYLAFRPLNLIKRGGHPVTFQYKARQIIKAAEAVGFEVDEFTYIPRGRFVLQFGHRWPSVLTPAKPIKLVLRRP